MSIYRNVVWFTKGMLEYTRSGYERASKNFNPLDLEVDCSNKSYMVTGANSGIGKAIAIEIAKRGGHIHMLCRNEDKAKIAREEIRNISGNENLLIHIVDMSEPKQVYEFAKRFTETHETLHVLINNAGCMLNTREINSEGMEINFATNTLGIHILTTCLIPILGRSVAPRVVTISSGGMLVQKLDVEDLQYERLVPFDGTMVYAQTKRQLVIMSEKYAERNPGIHFSTVNPGWADTPGFRNSMTQFYEKMQNRLRTTSEGADTAVWLAISNASLKLPSGQFYLDRKSSATHLPLAWSQSNPGDEDTLMSLLDSYLEIYKI